MEPEGNGRNIQSRKSEEIVVKVTYDDIDLQILDILSRNDSTVSQIMTILKFNFHSDVGHMTIAKKLDYLQILGKVEKRRKNARVFEYSLIK